MAIDLTDKACRQAPPPVSGNRIYYDQRVRGFGLRVTAAGIKSFVINYRTPSGIERRHTIGRYPEINLLNARKRAAELKDQIKHNGADPVGERGVERSAPTVSDLCDRFIEQHVAKKRPATQAEYRAAINKIILPAWRNRKIADIKFADVEALHRKITKAGTNGLKPAPYQANRVLAVLSVMFRVAKRLQWITELPTEGIERNQEARRYRYLSRMELDALQVALIERDQHARVRSKDKKGRDRAADIVRILLLTGARCGEVCSMRWRDLDLRDGVWSKPSAHTKQKLDHRVPLSGPARKLLADIWSRNTAPPEESDPVFPGLGTDAPQTTLKKSWAAIRRRTTVILYAANPESQIGALVCQLRTSLDREPTMTELDAAATAMGITLPTGLRDLRLHDLRHSYASFLVSEGLSLPTIGALLGHTQAQTTHRYAHLFDDPLRKATERIGEIMSGLSDSEAVIQMKRVGP